MGHKFVSSLEKRDIVFFDCHTRLFDYYQPILDQVLSGGLPIVSFCEFDFGGMSKEVYPAYTSQQKRFFEGADTLGLNVVHFVRKMDKTNGYQKNVYPYEKCIMNEFPITSSGELFSRPYDFCFIGNESPQRKNTVNGLLNAGLNGHVHWTNEKGKLPHSEWLDLHKQAKLFLSADGGGFTDERMQQLITVSPMLKQKNNHLQIAPFIDCVNCLMVSENPTEEEISGIKQVLKDSGYLYEIYDSGVEYANKYYTEEWRALYILKILQSNKII